MKKMIIGLVAMMSVLSMSAQGIYDISVKDDLGNDVSLADYKGKVLLIVNTATRCGFTPQYDELEALYEKYHAQGFEILDFPCNQFGEQAPGTIEEIHQFCTMNFNIKFPQFDKIDVNGANESPLFTYLKAQKGFGGFDLNDQRGKFMDEMLRKQDADYDKKSDIKWNFTKFLVSRDGRVVKRYEPTDKMTDVDADIMMEMNPVLSNIMARRSVRKYLDKPVEHEKLEVIVRAGINAPSGMNRQPWIVRVVEDQ
ncbi:MAG: nitroreductase family protein, partial [Muribaculaceae bacterium]|nr:nitroreductase family protein [Muribaculaceae bacterium]